MISPVDALTMDMTVSTYLFLGGFCAGLLTYLAVLLGIDSAKAIYAQRARRRSSVPALHSDSEDAV